MWILGGGVGALLGGGLLWTRAEPSGSGSFVAEHARQAEVVIDGGQVTIRNFRDFIHHSADSATIRYVERTFDLGDVETVWYVLTPFSDDWRGPAHSFLSFGLADSSFVAVSVEARRERGEDYSMVGGLLHRYEVHYVIGSELDLIGLRAVHRDPAVLVYPMRATAEAARALLEDMLRRAERLRHAPEFYNTLLNNCTTNILDHVNTIAPGDPIPWGPRILLPGYSDQLAYERGLIDTELSLEEARARFRVNERARLHAGRPDFSRRIRGPDAGS